MTNYISISFMLFLVILIKSIFSTQENINIEKEIKNSIKLYSKKVYDDTIIVTNNNSIYNSNTSIKSEIHIHVKVSDDAEKGKYIKFKLKRNNLNDKNNYNTIFIYLSNYGDTIFPSYKLNSLLATGYESALLLETYKIKENEFYMTVDCYYNETCDFDLIYQMYKDDNIIIDSNENFYINFNESFKGELLYCPKNISEKSLITINCLQLTDFNITLSYNEINGDIIENEVKVENIYYNGYSIFLDESINFEFIENACFHIKINYLENNIQNFPEYIYISHRDLGNDKKLFFGSYFYSYIKKELYEKDCFHLTFSEFINIDDEVLFTFQTKTKNMNVLFYNETGEIDDTLEIKDISETFSYINIKNYKNMCIITNSDKPQGVLFTVNHYSNTFFTQNLSMPLIRGLKLKSKVKHQKFYLYRVESYRNVNLGNKGRLKYNFYSFDGLLYVNYSECKIPRCNFNNMILPKTFPVNNHHFLQYSYDNDPFHKENIKVAFVKCERGGKDGCGFYVNVFSEKSELNNIKDNDIILINENFKEYGVIEMNKEEVYALDLYSEKNIYNLYLYINLYVYNGNVDLYLYEDKQLKKEIKEINFIGSYKSESVKIDMSKFQNISDYIYLKIKSNQESYFSIEYHFSEKNKSYFEYEMKVGETTLFTTSNEYDEYNFKFKKKFANKGFINVNVLNNCNFTIKYNETSSKEKIKKFKMINSNLSNLELKNGKECILNLNSYEIGEETLLHTDFPNYNYLESTTDIVKYVYPLKLIEENSNDILIIFKKFSEGDIKLDLKINNAVLIYEMKIIDDYKIILLRESMLYIQGESDCKGENNLCSLKIDIRPFNKIETGEKLYFSIEINKGIKYPSYFQKNELYINSFMSNIYNYFLFDINQNEEIEIIINSIKGSFNAIGKLIQKKEDLDYEADFRKKIKLPLETDKNLTKYNYYDQKLKITKEESKNCKNKCYFVLGIYNYELNFFSLVNVYSILYKTLDNKYVNFQENVPVINTFSFGSNEVEEHYYKIIINKNIKFLRFCLNFDELLDEEMDIKATITLESYKNDINYILNKEKKFIEINGDLYQKTFNIKISKLDYLSKINSIAKIKYEFKGITFITLNNYYHLIDVYGDHDSSCIFNSTNNRCYYKLNIPEHFFDKELILFFPNYENLVIYGKNCTENNYVPSYEYLPSEENYTFMSKTQLKTNFIKIKIQKPTTKIYGYDYYIFLLVVNKITLIKDTQIDLIISNLKNSFNNSYITSSKDNFYRVGAESNLILKLFYDNNKLTNFTNIFYINILVLEGKGKIINKENNIDILLDEEQNSNIYFMLKEGNLNLYNMFKTSDFVVYMKVRKETIINNKYNINYINNFGGPNIYMLKGSKLNNIFYLNAFNVPEINKYFLQKREQEFFIQIRIQDLIPLHEINFKSYIVDDDFIVKSKYNKELIKKDGYIEYDYMKYDYSQNKIIVHYKINASFIKNNSQIMLSAFYINVDYKERMKAIEIIPYSFDLYGNFPQSRFLIGVAYNKNNLIILSPYKDKDEAMNIEFSLSDFINFNISINYYHDTHYNYSSNDTAIELNEERFLGKSILRIRNKNHDKLCINIFPINENNKNENLTTYFMLKYNSKKTYLNNLNLANTSILNINEINNKSSIKSNFSELSIKVNSLMPIPNRTNPNSFFNYSIHYLIRFFNSSLVENKEDLNNFFDEYEIGNPLHIKEVIFYYYYIKGANITTNNTGYDSIIVNLDDITKENYYISVYSYGSYENEEHFIYEAFNLNLSEPKTEKNDIQKINKIIFTIAYILGGATLLIIIVTVSIIIYVKKNMPLTSRLDVLKQRLTVSSRSSKAFANNLRLSNRGQNL